MTDQNSDEFNTPPGVPMPHSHINDKDEFQSDRHPNLKPDKIVLSFNDPCAWSALAALAEAYRVFDPQLSRDIYARLLTMRAGAID